MEGGLDWFRGGEDARIIGRDVITKLTTTRETMSVEEAPREDKKKLMDLFVT